MYAFNFIYVQVSTCVKNKFVRNENIFRSFQFLRYMSMFVGLYINVSQSTHKISMLFSWVVRQCGPAFQRNIWVPFSALKM
jgi:hypothetical protein